jgi:hypothetical protein
VLRVTAEKRQWLPVVREKYQRSSQLVLKMGDWRGWTQRLQKDPEVGGLSYQTDGISAASWAIPVTLKNGRSMYRWQ